MNLSRCQNGHFFDKEKYVFCPHCSSLDLVDPIVKTYNPLDGKWEFVALLGKGGFGRTYKLVDKTNIIENYSVLKVISFFEDEAHENLESDLFSNNTIKHTQKQLLEMLNEVTLMYTLNISKNIVNIFKHFVYKRDEEQAWDILIQMELLTPIDKYFNETPYTEKDIIDLSIDICSALKICEKYNIVHQDIKPSNIFVDSNKTFKLGDFGSAKFLSTKESDKQNDHTMYYCAPEIYKGKGASFSSDIYSLGLTLYKYMNGNIFPDIVASYAITNYETTTTSECSIADIVLPPPQYASKSFADIILKSCALDIKHRYKNVSELLKDLMALDKVISPIYNKETFISNNQISNNDKVTAIFNDDIPLPIVNSHIGEQSKIGDETTVSVPFDGIAMPLTNSHTGETSNDQAYPPQFNTEPFVPNSLSFNQDENTSLFDDQLTMPLTNNHISEKFSNKDNPPKFNAEPFVPNSLSFNQDENTSLFDDQLTMPLTNNHISEKFSNKDNPPNLNTEPFVSNDQPFNDDDETTAIYDTENAIPFMENRSEKDAENENISPKFSTNSSTSTYLKNPDDLGKRIINKMINWVFFTCVFSLIPLIIYILFKYLFDVEISLIDKLVTDFFYFGLTLSVVTIREMFSHKLWKKEKCIYLMALFIILLILILSTTFFGAMTMSEMKIVTSQLNKNYLLKAAFILGLSSFVTGSFIQIWEEM